MVRLSDPTLPDFDLIHEKYIQEVMNGRHQSSFTKKSELWFYYNLSNNRLNKVSSGMKLNDVLENDDDYRNLCKRYGMSSSIKKNGNELKAQTKLSSPYISVAGIQLNVKDSIPIQHSIQYALMNDMNEVLCYDKKNQIYCKHVSEVSQRERFNFVLIDLADCYKNEPISIGDKVWLQMVGYDSSSETNKKNVVVGSKPWGKVDFDDIAVVQPKGLGDINQTYGNENRLTNDGSNITSNNPQLPKPNGSSKSVSAAIVGHLDAVKVNDNKEESAMQMSSRTYTKQSWYIGQWCARRADQKYAEEGLTPLTSQTPVYLEQDLYCLASSNGSSLFPFPKKVNDFVSRPKLRSATSSGLKLSSMSTAMALSEIMGLENFKEDVDSGTSVSRNSSRPSSSQVQMLNVLNRNIKISAREGSMSETFSSRPHTRESVVTGLLDQNKKLACIRKVTISDQPNSKGNYLDSACVWKFTPIDMEGQIKLLRNNNDNFPQQILSKATRLLKESEEKRMARDFIHADEENKLSYQDKDQHIPFSKSLSKALLTRSRTEESLALEQIRRKEADIKTYFSVVEKYVNKNIRNLSSKKRISGMNSFREILESDKSEVTPEYIPETSPVLADCHSKDIPLVKGLQNLSSPNLYKSKTRLNVETDSKNITLGEQFLTLHEEMIKSKQSANNKALDESGTKSTVLSSGTKPNLFLEKSKNSMKSRGSSIMNKTGRRSGALGNEISLSSIKSRSSKSFTSIYDVSFNDEENNSNETWAKIVNKLKDADEHIVNVLSTREALQMEKKGKLQKLSSSNLKLK